MVITENSPKQEIAMYISDLKKFVEVIPKDGNLTPFFMGMKFANKFAIVGLFGSIVQGLYGLVSKDYMHAKNSIYNFLASLSFLGASAFIYDTNVEKVTNGEVICRREDINELIEKLEKKLTE